MILDIILVILSLLIPTFFIYKGIVGEEEQQVEGNPNDIEEYNINNENIDNNNIINNISENETDDHQLKTEVENFLKKKGIKIEKIEPEGYQEEANKFIAEKKEYESRRNEVIKIIQNLSFNIEHHADLLKQQEENMRELEYQAEENRIAEKKAEKDRIAKEKAEEEKLKEIDKRAEEAKNKIGEEPKPENKDNSTTICFRYPEGDKRIERRFLKSEKIGKLYVYVTSLGRDIYIKGEELTFSLYQPFPPKKYDNMENTLEKEGLFPNAIIQIRLGK